MVSATARVDTVASSSWKMSDRAAWLCRPFTPHSFRRSVDEFDRLMKEITLSDVQATPDERRQHIAGATRLRYVTSGLSER